MTARESIIEEIKLAPESLLKEAYDFFLFLKSRQAAEHGAPPSPSSLVTSAPTAPQEKGRGRAGAWARMARGSARFEAAETRDDARMAYYREKLGVR